MNPWLALTVAGVLEVIWAVGLKYSYGFSKPWPTIVTLIGMAGSMFFLAQALKTIPLGTGYAIWTGVGAVGTAILGIILFSESTALPRLFCIALIVAGIAGLKLTSTTN